MGITLSRDTLILVSSSKIIRILSNSTVTDDLVTVLLESIAKLLHF